MSQTQTGNSIDVQVSLLSFRHKYADIEFLYRSDFGEAWKTDAFVSASTAKFIDGNKLFRMPCLPHGYPNIIRWKFEKNGLTTGNKCQIKVKILPAITTLNFYKNQTTAESIYNNKFNEIQSVIPHKILGIDNYGNWIGLNEDNFIVVDSNKQIIMNYGGIGNLSSCCQIYNDNYILLDNGSAKIIEVSKTGSLVFELFSPVLFQNPIHFTYDKYNNNIVLVDSSKNMAYELSWNDGDKGTLLWQHGGLGYSIDELDNPTAITYDSANRSIVYIADSGNARIKKIDRSDFDDSIEIIEYLEKDGAEIGINPISRIFTDNSNIIVVESEQEQEFFNENINLHPPLARAMNLKDSEVATKNNINEYRNLLFAPVNK